MNTDTIKKQTLFKAPRDRVWQAISDPTQFGIWFGVRFDGPFVAGQWLTGVITPTQVDPEVAKMQESYAGLQVRFLIETITPKDLFVFRWHPYAVDRDRDYSHEPTTCVTFTLADADGGTLLTITESGFDQLPAELRAEAFMRNDGGWTHQMALIGKYLA